MNRAIKRTGLNILIYGSDSVFFDLLGCPPGPYIGEVYVSPREDDIFHLIKEKNIAVLFMDIGSDQEKGLDFLYKVKEYDALLDVILVGNSLDKREIMELINSGAKDYLPVPFDTENIIRILEGIHSKKALRRETLLLERKLGKKYQFHSIVGKTPQMLEIFSLVEKISKYFTCVLLTGETGTGKELVAHAIHTLSRPKNTEFVICDCSSIPDNLFESELFGYVKGAFTGADRDKKGLFEEAHEGIIFLDELGEIPLTVQAKLLRVMEQHQFRPLGSNTTRTVDVQVITATNQDLKARVKNGTFREDLYHRLNKVEIHIPPLRERREDIPLLVRHFLGRYQKKFQKELKGVSRRTQKLFQWYAWPGNIRELDNVLERASMVAKNEFIDIPDLPKYLQKEAPPEKILPFIQRENLSTLDDLEREYISHLLKVTGNNLRKTASILDISRTTLYNKIRKYDIETD